MFPQTQSSRWVTRLFDAQGWYWRRLPASTSAGTTLSPASLVHTRGQGTPVVSSSAPLTGLVHTRGTSTPKVNPTLKPASLVHTRGQGTPGVFDPYQLEILGDAPILYWRLKEAGGTAADASGNGRTGTYSGTVAAVGGLAARSDNGASDFTDDSGLVTSDATVNHAAGTDPFSVEVWVQPDAIHADEHIAHWVNVFQLQVKTDGVRVACGSNIDDTSGALPTATPTHLVFSFDGADGRIYRNGRLVAGPTAASGVVANSNVYAAGLEFGVPIPQFDGKLDEFALYDVVLSLTQVQDHYTAGGGIIPDSLIHTRGIGTPKVNPKLFPASLVHARGQGAVVVSPKTTPTGLVHTRGQGAPVVSPTLPRVSLVHTRGQGAAKVNVKILTASVTHGRAQGTITVTSGVSLSPASIVHTRGTSTPTVSAVLKPLAQLHSRGIGTPLMQVKIFPASITHGRALGTPIIPGGPVVDDDSMRNRMMRGMGL